MDINNNNPSFKPQTANGNTSLSVFYVNDSHGDINRLGKLKTAHDKFEKENKDENNITMASGDIFIGQDDKKNNLFLNLLNKIGVNYLSLGNHEFDDSSDKLAERLKDAEFTTVAANLEIPEHSKLAERVKDAKLVKSKICMQNGTNFAIIGASPVNEEKIDKWNKNGNVTVKNIDDTIKAINEEAKKLEAQGINKIILLSHVGYGEEADLKIAQETEGIDIIIGGHSHTSINGVQKEDKGGDNLKNLVYSKRNEPVVITQTNGNNNDAGYLNVLFDDKGILIEDKIVNKLNNLEAFETSQEVENDIEDALGKNEKLAKINLKYSPKNTEDGKFFAERWYENPTANVMLDAVMDKAKSNGVEVAFMNSPAIRDNFGNDVSTYDIKFTMLPFNGNFGMVDLTEKEFVEAFEKSALTAVKTDNSQMFQVSGMRYEIDRTDANVKSGQGLIKKIEILNDKNEVVRTIDPQNPDATKTIKCAVNDYLTLSECVGDIFSVHKAEIKENSLGGQQELLIDYLKNSQELNVGVEGRINIKENKSYIPE